MKKIKVLMLLTTMALVAGCGKKETAEDKKSTESVAVVDAGEETLMVPEVSMGETKPGEDAVEVVFTWDAVKGADGYEVYEENKFYDEDEYRESEGVTSTTGCSKSSLTILNFFSTAFVFAVALTVIFPSIALFGTIA